MLEESMSVWPQTQTGGALSGSEGALISISIDVDARDLEALLEALAQVSFPINPQIYHEAAMVYQYPDGHEEAEPTTLVEFPAYAGQLGEVREQLRKFGFVPSCAHVTGMLAEIHAESSVEPAPPGATYVSRYRRKSPGISRTAGHQP